MDVLTLLATLVASALAQDTRLEVDSVAGGIGRVAVILTARHGTPVTFEGVPLLAPGVDRLAIRTQIGTVMSASPLGLGCGVRFSYPGDATPRAALGAAVHAYNAGGCPGHYLVLDDHGILHLVPFESRLADGSWAPYSPLLDTPVRLRVLEGSPNEVLFDLRSQLEAASGVTLRPMTFAVGVDGPEVVRMPRAQGSARELLDDLLLQLAQETHYFLIYQVSDEPTEEGFVLEFLNSRPEHDGQLNRTPLVPAEPAPWK